MGDLVAGPGSAVKQRRDAVAVRRGFSLVELLVAAAIAALVLTALVAAFAGGIRVWERARSLGKKEQELCLALEELERDLRNAFTFRGIAFEGRETSLTVPGLLRASDLGGARTWRVGTIRYAEDRGRRSLTRARWVFGERESPGVVEELVTGVVRVRFAYWGVADSSGVAAWGPTWLDRTNRPAAVRVEVNVLRSGEQFETTRTIVLPCRS